MDSSIACTCNNRLETFKPSHLLPRQVFSLAAEPYIAEDEVAAAGHEVLMDTADEGQLLQVGLDLPQLVLEEVTLVVELGPRHQRRQQ